MQELLAVISLPRIRANADAVLRLARRPLIAVVKDDAYGHGAAEVAHALRGRAEMFAVATVREGAELRIAGIGEDILVLTPPLSSEEAEKLARYELLGTISSPKSLALLAEAGRRTGGVRAHLAVNTGMNRYGVSPARAGSTALSAKQCGIRVEGVYSHLYDPLNGRAAAEQSELFSRAAADVRKIFPDCMRHLSATGGLPAGEGDAVRVGLALYGYAPDGLRLPVRPAMKLYAAVSHTCTQLGGGLGYAEAPERYGKLYTLRLGYGDGFFRAGLPGACGKLCMDACICRGEARTGRRKRVAPDLAAYAAACGTTVYEVLVNVAGKAERRYVR